MPDAFTAAELRDDLQKRLETAIEALKADRNWRVNPQPEFIRLSGKIEFAECVLDWLRSYPVESTEGP